MRDGKGKEWEYGHGMGWDGMRWDGMGGGEGTCRSLPREFNVRMWPRALVGSLNKYQCLIRFHDDRLVGSNDVGYTLDVTLYQRRSLYNNIRIDQTNEETNNQTNEETNNPKKRTTKPAKKRTIKK